MGITFKRAKYIIGQSRNIKDEPGMEGPWTETALQRPATSAIAPTGFSCRAPVTGTVTVHATNIVMGRAWAICHGEVNASGAADLKDHVKTTKSIEAAARDMGGNFCEACRCRLRASLILRVERFYKRQRGTQGNWASHPPYYIGSS